MSKSITQQFQWRATSTAEKDVEVKVKRARKSPPEASLDAARISGYCREFLVRKLLLDKLAHEPCDIDWASITVTEFTRYCPDQAHALDSCPTEWSAEDLSMFLFGRKGWAIFASYFSCQLKTLLSDPDTRDESEIAEVTEVLASDAWLEACRQRHATVGIAGHPLDLYNSLKSKKDSDF